MSQVGPSSEGKETPLSLSPPTVYPLAGRPSTVMKMKDLVHCVLADKVPSTIMLAPHELQGRKELHGSMAECHARTPRTNHPAEYAQGGVGESTQPETQLPQ